MIKLFPAFFFFLCIRGSAQIPSELIESKDDIVVECGVSCLPADQIYADGWEKLAQPLFWKRIMTLSPDSLLINIAATREVIDQVSIADWNKQTDEEKDAFRDSIRYKYCLNEDAHVYVTSGKKDFYKFQKVFPELARGIAQFEKNNVDPWYAQSILLIESPGQLKKSRVGAYGPFQLMPRVARAQGLTVNRSKDDRQDFDKSAYGASRLIKRVCIPEAKKILDAQGLKYNETDLWFRLFVLHVYHAGAGNVKAVVQKINPKKGGQQLIRRMWQTKAAQFGNNSQNYSQLALASQIIIDERREQYESLSENN